MSVEPGPQSFELRNPSYGRIFLELQSVVPGDNAIHIPPSQLNHTLLIANVGSVVGVRECGAGFAFDEIAIEIAIVGGQNEGRIAFDAEIL